MIHLNGPICRYWNLNRHVERLVSKKLEVYRGHSPYYGFRFNTDDGGIDVHFGAEDRYILLPVDYDIR